MRGLLLHNDLFFFGSLFFSSGVDLSFSFSSTFFESTWLTGQQQVCIRCWNCGMRLMMLKNVASNRENPNVTNHLPHLVRHSMYPSLVKLCTHHCHEYLPHRLGFAMSYSYYGTDHNSATSFSLHSDAMRPQTSIQQSSRMEKSWPGSRFPHKLYIFCSLPATNWLESRVALAYRTSPLHPPRLLHDGFCATFPETGNL